MITLCRWWMTMLFCLTTLLTLSSCGGKEEGSKRAEEGASQTDERVYQPPEDGKVTQQQVEAFVAVTLALTQVNTQRQEELRGFLEKYDLVTSPERLMADSAYRESHPHVVREYRLLLDGWEKQRGEIYGQHGLTEAEFNWIAEALGRPDNREVAEVVRRKMTEAVEGEGG